MGGRKDQLKTGGMIKLIRSFRYAASGILVCFKTQSNFRIHILAATVAVIAGAGLQISRLQWAIIAICISMMLVTELLNTAIEKICDHVNPSYHPHIKIIKDMAAGAVLVVAMMSIIAGALIFIPAFIHYLNL